MEWKSTDDRFVLFLVLHRDRAIVVLLKYFPEH
uniref:Uncharacterized protein n=1 Tax=Anguilla anguilla TaxID=7936 RepID=A0A0E9UE48_ANGAN